MGPAPGGAVVCSRELAVLQSDCWTEPSAEAFSLVFPVLSLVCVPSMELTIFISYTFYLKIILDPQDVTR